VGQAGAGDPGTGQKKGTPTSGQIRSESPSPPTPILAAVHPEPPGTTLTEPYDHPLATALFVTPYSCLPAGGFGLTS
jgi:hypothetical protein